MDFLGNLKLPRALAGAIAGAAIGLSLYNVGQSEAATWALLFHIASFIPITLIGAYYMNLRFERLALVYIAILPLLLLVLMLFAVVPDAATLFRRP